MKVAESIMVVTCPKGHELRLHPDSELGQRYERPKPEMQEHEVLAYWMALHKECVEEAPSLGY